MDVLEDRISIFDSGPGMDGSDENSIVKWYVLAVFFAFSLLFSYHVLHFVVLLQYRIMTWR